MFVVSAVVQDLSYTRLYPTKNVVRYTNNDLQIIIHETM